MQTRASGRAFRSAARRRPGPNDLRAWRPGPPPSRARHHPAAAAQRRNGQGRIVEPCGAHGAPRPRPCLGCRDGGRQGACADGSRRRNLSLRDMGRRVPATPLRRRGVCSQRARSRRRSGRCSPHRGPGAMPRRGRGYATASCPGRSPTRYRSRVGMPARAGGSGPAETGGSTPGPRAGGAAEGCGSRTSVSPSPGRCAVGGPSRARRAFAGPGGPPTPRGCACRERTRLEPNIRAGRARVPSGRRKPRLAIRPAPPGAGEIGHAKHRAGPASGPRHSTANPPAAWWGENGTRRTVRPRSPPDGVRQRIDCPSDRPMRAAPTGVRIESPEAYAPSSPG